MMAARCGTKAGYTRHYRLGERPCAACRAAANAYRRGLSARKRNGTFTRESLTPCGTYGAYRRHRRKGEDPCDGCREAARAYERKTRKPPTTPMDTTRCGTLAGYVRHRKRDMRPCSACLEAKRTYDNERNRDRGIQPKRPPPACGTLGGYRRHVRQGTVPCLTCKRAKREADRERLGRRPFQAAKCGTRSGYQRHWRRGEAACEPCLVASRKSTKPRRHWAQLWEAQSGHCALCDQVMPREAASVHVDHIVPKSKDGDDNISNLQATHPRCNLIKRDQDNDAARRLLLGQAA